MFGVACRACGRIRIAVRKRNAMNAACEYFLYLVVTIATRRRDVEFVDLRVGVACLYRLVSSMTVAADGRVGVSFGRRESMDAQIVTRHKAGGMCHPGGDFLRIQMAAFAHLNLMLPTYEGLTIRYLMNVVLAMTVRACRSPFKAGLQRPAMFRREILVRHVVVACGTGAGYVLSRNGRSGVLG